MKFYKSTLLKGIYCLTFCTLCFADIQAATVDGILVTVGDQVILKSDLDNLQENLKKDKLVDLEYARLFQKGDIKSNRQAQIDYLISEKIFLNQSKKLGLFDSAVENLDKEIGKIAASNKMTMPELRREIEKEGIDFNDYRNFTLNSLIRKRVIEQVIASKIDISESDIIQHLQRTGAKTFIPKYEYKLSSIKLDKSTNVDLVDKTIKKQGFYTALKFSIDDAERGELGSFKEGEMSPTIERAVKDLKINEVSAPIKLGEYTMFIKLDDKIRINSLPNTPEVARARNELIQKNLTKEVETWIEDQKQTSHIKNFDT